MPTKHGFSKDSKPFFYHEVIDRNDGAVLVSEYFHLGWVTEFRYSQKIGCAANGDWGMFGGLYDPVELVVGSRNLVLIDHIRMFSLSFHL